MFINQAKKSTAPSEEAGHLDYSKKFFVRCTFFTTVLFLFLPIITIFVFSFNDSRRITVWSGFTLKNYAKAWNNSSLYDAFINSLVIALAASIASILLALLSAYALRFFQFRLKSAYQGILSIPIVIPEVCMGIALLIFFNKIFGSLSVDMPWPFNLSLVTIAHVTFCFPFATLVIESRLRLLNQEMVEAAADLGANEFQIFKDIVIPYLKPALLAAFLLSFTLSLDDFVITFFTTGPETGTLPIKIYSMLRFSVSPEVNAASSILILITLFLSLLAALLQKRTV